MSGSSTGICCFHWSSSTPLTQAYHDSVRRARCQLLAAAARIRLVNTAAAFRCSLLTFLLALVAAQRLRFSYYMLPSLLLCFYQHNCVLTSVQLIVRPLIWTYMCLSLRLSARAQLRFQFLVKVFCTLTAMDVALGAGVYVCMHVAASYCNPLNIQTCVLTKTWHVVF